MVEKLGEEDRWGYRRQLAAVAKHERSRVSLMAQRYGIVGEVVTAEPLAIVTFVKPVVVVLGGGAAAIDAGCAVALVGLKILPFFKALVEGQPG